MIVTHSFVKSYGFDLRKYSLDNEITDMILSNHTDLICVSIPWTMKYCKHDFVKSYKFDLCEHSLDNKIFCQIIQI
jgi:hypothetical protein